MNQIKLKDILDKHGKYLRNEVGGVRADLRFAKEDFFKRLLIAKNEAQGLYDALMRGKIDGLAYKGKCACFVGTVANIRKENHDNLTIALKPEADSATEKWFLAILKGDTPANNPVAEITAEWMREFMKEHSILVPDYRLVSSLEMPELFRDKDI